VLKAAQKVVEGQAQCSVCGRNIVETQGACAIAGLLISGFAVPIPAASLVLPMSLELGIQRRDDGGRPHPARVIEDPDARADADGIALVTEGVLAWNSSHQEPEPL